MKLRKHLTEAMESDNPHNVYGYDLVLDLESCDTSKFNRDGLRKYIIQLCDVIEMKRGPGPYFWDDHGLDAEQLEQEAPHLEGTSVIQFIETSSIVIHTLVKLKKVFLDCFSCKTFDPKKASEFTRKYFSGDITQSMFIERR